MTPHFSAFLFVYHCVSAYMKLDVVFEYVGYIFFSVFVLVVENYITYNCWLAPSVYIHQIIIPHICKHSCVLSVAFVYACRYTMYKEKQVLVVFWSKVCVLVVHIEKNNIYIYIYIYLKCMFLKIYIHIYMYIEKTYIYLFFFKAVMVSNWYNTK